MKLRLALALVLVGSVAVLGGRASGSRQAPEPAPGNQSRPTLAFDGAKYLVAWADDRDQGTRALGASSWPASPQPPPPARSGLYGTRVSTSGKVLDAGGRAISKSEYNEFSGAQAVPNGRGSILVWTDRRDGLDFAQGAHVGRRGALAAATRFAIASDTSQVGYNIEAAAASGGENYLVVWELYSGVFANLVTSSGVVRPPPTRVISQDHSAFDVAVAFDGTNYLVVWAENRFPAGFFIYAARVSQNGDVLDPDGILVAEDAYFAPKVAFNGTNYLIVWGTEALFGKRVSPDGHVLDLQPIPIATTGGDPYNPDNAVGSDGANWLVAWSRESPGSIIGTRINAHGTVLDPQGIVISSSQRNKHWPAIAFDGKNYFVAWSDDRDLTADIYGTRVSRVGRVLDPRGILISTAPPKARCVVPRVTGMRLTKAKRKIRRARCSVGGVRTSVAKRLRGRVLAQNPRSGRIRPVSYPVRLVVGR